MPSHMLSPVQIEACTRAAHESNRAYCIAIGDDSQVPWEEAPDWQRSAAMAGVEGALAGDTPEQSHANWMAQKAADGWTRGPVKNPEAKEHPCMVPYAQLPPEQRAKDAIFVRVVREVAAAFGGPFTLDHAVFEGSEETRPAWAGKVPQ